MCKVSNAEEHCFRLSSQLYYQVIRSIQVMHSIASRDQDWPPVDLY